MIKMFYDIIPGGGSGYTSDDNSEEKKGLPDINLVIPCDGACEGHHILIKQVHFPEEEEAGYDHEVFITIHLDSIPFWQRVRWVLTGKNKRYGHFVSTITTKKKLQQIVNQLR